MTFVLRLTAGDRGRAEDVIQETMVRAWREADRLDLSGPSLMPWLATVARRIVIDEHRRQRPRAAEQWPGTLAESIDDESTATILRVAVADAMRALSPAHRQVLSETILRDRTACQAAEVLGIPVGTVKSRVFHALRALEVILAERDLRSISALPLGLDDRRALDRDAHRGQGRGRGAVHDGAVLNAELAPVARAVDGAVGHGVDDAALVGAHGGERLERASSRLGDHDLLPGEDLPAADRDLAGGGQGGGPGAGGPGAIGTSARRAARSGRAADSPVVGVVRRAARDEA